MLPIQHRGMTRNYCADRYILSKKWGASEKGKNALPYSSCAAVTSSASEEDNLAVV